MTDSAYVDLEIRIYPREATAYPVEITLVDENRRQEFSGTLTADIFPWVSSGDLQADGERLFNMLLADPELRSAWDEAEGRSIKRRLRLRLDMDAPELHDVPWELLRTDEMMLSANATTPFSRYQQGKHVWHSPGLVRPLRVLVVISSPKDLERYNLATLDVELEHQALDTAVQALDNVEIDYLSTPVTLSRLKEKLREGYHVLHYLGHGGFNRRRQQAALYLQDEAGNTQLVTDDEFIAMLQSQSTQPGLIFLTACESASRSVTDAFKGLGPKLVDAGAPAVIAMQDRVSIQTARELSQTFYRYLAEDGVVDRALNEARSTLLTKHYSDAAVPVLFMRVLDGRIFKPSRALKDKIAAWPLWTKLLALFITLLLILALGTTAYRNIIQSIPTPTPTLIPTPTVTPTPDPLPLITEAQAPGEYLVLVANYDDRRDKSPPYDIGYRIYELLDRNAAYLGPQGRLRIASQSDVVVHNEDDAQGWGEKHLATIVIWGWYDQSGLRSYIHAINMERIPDLEWHLPEVLEKGEVSNDYLEQELPQTINYIILSTIGIIAQNDTYGDEALQLFNLAEEQWAMLPLEEQAVLTDHNLGLGYLYVFRALVYSDLLGELKKDTPEETAMYQQTMKQKAIQVYEEALTIEGPHVPHTHYNLGLLYSELDNAQAAETHWQAFIEDPGDQYYLVHLAYIELGNTLSQLSRREEAETAYAQAKQHALELGFQDPYLPLSRGWQAYLRDDLSTAEAYYQEALDITPEYPIPHFKLALIYLQRYEEEKAKTAYTQALALCPDWFEEAALSQHYTTAQEDLETLLEQHPDLETLARPLYQMLEQALVDSED